MNEFHWRSRCYKYIVAEPCTVASIAERLNALLNGMEGYVPPHIKQESNSDGGRADFVKRTLEDLVGHIDLSFALSAVPSVWQAVFDVAGQCGFNTHECRAPENICDICAMADQSFNLVLANVQVIDRQYDLTPRDRFDKNGNWNPDPRWMAASLGAASLLCLGHSYSPTVYWAVLNDTLCRKTLKAHQFLQTSPMGGEMYGKEGGGRESVWDGNGFDTERIGACIQLLAAGKQIQKYFKNGGDIEEVPALGEKTVSDAREKSLADVELKTILYGLEWQQLGARLEVANLLERTRQHLSVRDSNLTGPEIAQLIARVNWGEVPDEISADRLSYLVRRFRALIPDDA